MCRHIGRDRHDAGDIKPRRTSQKDDYWDGRSGRRKTKAKNPHRQTVKSKDKWQQTLLLSR